MYWPTLIRSSPLSHIIRYISLNDKNRKLVYKSNIKSDFNKEYSDNSVIANVHNNQSCAVSSAKPPWSADSLSIGQDLGVHEAAVGNWHQTACDRSFGKPLNECRLCVKWHTGRLLLLRAPHAFHGWLKDSGLINAWASYCWPFRNISYAPYFPGFFFLSCIVLHISSACVCQSGFAQELERLGRCTGPRVPFDMLRGLPAFFWKSHLTVSRLSYQRPMNFFGGPNRFGGVASCQRKHTHDFCIYLAAIRISRPTALSTESYRWRDQTTWYMDLRILCRGSWNIFRSFGTTWMICERFAISRGRLLLCRRGNMSTSLRGLKALTNE